MSSLITALVLFSSGLSSFALNDWNSPCFQGHCTWDIPAERNSSGNLHIWGSSQAISDITPAAGWVILDCDANSKIQDIRLLCKGNETETGCGHLLDSGMEGKIVRLPEDCGSVPFARVSNTWISENQRILASQAARLTSSSSQVRAMSLDTNFSALDASKFGGVSFAVQLSNSPDASPDVTIPAQRRHYHHHHRSSLDSQALQRRSFFESATKALTTRGFTPFNKSNSVNLPPVDFDKSASVYSDALSDLKVDADLDTQMHMEIKLGAVVVGTVIPPKLDQAAITAGLNGNYNSTLHVKASGKTHFSSPSVTIIEIPFDGIEIADILEIGPDLKVTAQVTADLQVGIDGEVGLSYDVDDVTLVFPQDQGDSSASVNPSSSNTPSFSLNGAVDSVSSDTNITAHLTPALDVGLKVFGQGATITLALDNTATVELSGTVEPSSGNDMTGCVDVRTGIDIFASASAGLFDLFDVSARLDFFNKSFDLYKKCFDNGASSSSGVTSATPTSAPVGTTSSSAADQTTTTTATSLTANATSSSIASTASTTSSSTDAASSSTAPTTSAASNTNTSASSSEASASPTPTPYSTPVSDALFSTRKRHFGRDVRARHHGGLNPAGFAPVVRDGSKAVV